MGAPTIFREVKAKSRSVFQGNFTEVGKAINSQEEHEAVRRAIFSCPMKAIRWIEQPKKSLRSSSPLYEGYPKLIEDNVYYMGFSDKTTFGCAGFFIHGKDGPNILIDPPIAHPQLVNAVKRMGGVQHLLFTHKDHTGNQAVWHEATGAPRLMHTKDVVYTKNNHSPFPVTKDFEMLLKLKPLESMTLEGVPGFIIMSTPGHTPGSLIFIYKSKFLFTGDSLAFSQAKGHLHAHRIQCWQDWGTQITSLSGLQEYSFQWVLPGHGDWQRFSSPAAAQMDLRRCLQWMREQEMGYTPFYRFIMWTLLRPKEGGLVHLLTDSFVMPSGAKAHFPNWTLPSWSVFATLLLTFTALRFRSRLLLRLT